MNNYLPSVLENSKTFKEIYRVQGMELDLIKSYLKDLENQLNVDTATWGLDIYEKELEIKTDINKPLSERRSVIKSRWRGTGKLDNETIKRVVDSFTNGNVDVNFDGRIHILFNDVLGIPENMNDVYESIENIIPAHLRVIYEYIYRTYEELRNYTHQELSNHTHEKLREGVI